jgi:hypothetical protein
MCNITKAGKTNLKEGTGHDFILFNFLYTYFNQSPKLAHKMVLIGIQSVNIRPGLIKNEEIGLWGYGYF